MAFRAASREPRRRDQARRLTPASSDRASRSTRTSNPSRPTMGQSKAVGSSVPRSINTATDVAGVSKQQPAPGNRVDHAAPRRRAPGGPPATLRAHGGLGRSLCRSSSTMLRHRLLLSSRPRLESPARIRHRIYEPEYFATKEWSRQDKSQGLTESGSFRLYELCHRLR